MTTTSKSKMSTKSITSLAMLTGIAYVVMLCSKLLPSVNGFLDFDFKDVIICIGGFTYGPMAAAIISVLVAFIEFITVSGTGPIGFIMNCLATCSFCCTASFVYKKYHTKNGAVIGLGLGNLLGGMVLVETIFNWPGVGQFAYQSVMSNDYPAIIGVSLLVALNYMVINTIVDILYGVIDPRVRCS